MRPSRLNYYSDFVVYPVVIVGLTAAGVTHATWTERSEWLIAGAVGFVLWTLAEYILHRSVLHKEDLLRADALRNTIARRWHSSAHLPGSAFSF